MRYPSDTGLAWAPQYQSNPCGYLAFLSSPSLLQGSFYAQKTLVRDIPFLCGCGYPGATRPAIAVRGQLRAWRNLVYIESECRQSNSNHDRKPAWIVD